jgi:hypothetical protein
MEPQEVRGKTMQGPNLGLLQLFKRRPGPFAYLLSREMVTGPEDGEHVIGLLGQTKELCAESLLHFSCSFVGEGEGHDLCDGQGVWLSQEEVKDTIDEDRGLTSPGSRNHHDITVPGGLRQEPILGVSECQ